MKKLLAVLVIAASFAACNDNTHADETTTDTLPVTSVPATVDTAVMKMDTSAPKMTDTTTVK